MRFIRYALPISTSRRCPTVNQNQLITATRQRTKFCGNFKEPEHFQQKRKPVLQRKCSRNKETERFYDSGSFKTALQCRIIRCRLFKPRALPLRLPVVLPASVQLQAQPYSPYLPQLQPDGKYHPSRHRQQIHLQCLSRLNPVQSTNNRYPSSSADL